KNNCAWILNKFSIQLNDFPKFRDEVRIITWSRESHIIKAYRDFEIYAGQNFIGRASSLWVFTDLKTKNQGGSQLK
ncbi:acyl-ACP thioesterase domain-containing protein, partial [Candidatus Kryptobacter tengchongensis]